MVINRYFYKNYKASLINLVFTENGTACTLY